ncbi:MAG: FAD-dependent oxidoreductase, partial [Lachnospirales bacterium]
NKEKFYSQYRIDVRNNQEVVKINRLEKKISVQDVDTGKVYEETYDKLVLSPGSIPIVPKIDGIEDVSLFTIRNVMDINKLKKNILSKKSKKIAVIGGGFIGVEIAENLTLAGYDVTLVEGSNQILRTFDNDIVQIFHKELDDQGINLILNDKVKCFQKDTVVLESGKKIEAKTVVLAIGVAPETQLAKDSGINIGKTDAILVNKNYQTNDPHIYAIGDAAEVYNAIMKQKFKLPLAGPALKQARAVADHICGNETLNTGFIGSSAIKVFSYNGASTGLTETMVKNNTNFEYGVTFIIPTDKVGIMPNSKPMFLKLIFEIPTGKILGAQGVGKGDVTKRIDVIATAIKFNGTIYNLKDLELCYAPPFSTAKDIVNYAGYVSSNLLEGAFKQVTFAKVRELVEKNATIIDVREAAEFKNGHIINSINIPLSKLRENISKIPKEESVYIHCRTGQRSYNAIRMLQQIGYTKVYNIAGSYLGLSFYEYFWDKATGREPIVTKYNFN